ncbi:hypothetical protein LX36DRAFT_752896 [Colletotrichum falcatum]|nr:hypothetical protein LX36DRAFT_752896 [Colletotrichum falcatum]
MKTRFLFLAGITALVAAGPAADPRNTAHHAREVVAQEEHDRRPHDYDAAVTSAGETVTLRRRDCDIACPVDRRYCYYAPYNYQCDGRGRFTWSQRDTNCELPTSGCWCFCDWRPASGGGTKIVARESVVSGELA